MIDEKLIFIGLEYTEKTSLLNFCYKKLKELDYISDISEFADEIKKREEIMPTSVGFGVAIPHGRCTAVKRSFIVFIKSSEPFFWNRDDSEKSDLIFMIGVPEGDNAGNMHLRILSSISKKLMHDEFRDALRNGTDKEVYQLLNEIDQNITGGCSK